MNIEIDSYDIYDPNKEEYILGCVKQLENNEECFFNESDYGHGIIKKVGNSYECYSIPMYGGEEILEDRLDSPIDAVKLLASWT